MTYLIIIALCVGLALIAWQDFRYRAVHLLLLIAVLGLQIADGVLTLGFKTFFIGWGINVGLLLFQLGLLFLFWYLKHRKISNLLDHSLGKGDLFFFILLSAAFSVVNFILFFIVSLSITLMVSIIFYRKRLIPLAGWLALFYLAVLFLGMIIRVPRYIDLITP